MLDPLSSTAPTSPSPFHPSNADIRFFAEAVVEVGCDFLLQEFVEFLPTKVNCGACKAEAVEDGEY